MKKIFKAFISVIVILSLLLVSGIAVSAYDNVPETIKIGLFYGSSAKDSCKVSSESGIALSVSDDNSRYELAKDETINEITVKKDTLYHAILPDGYDDYSTAWEKQTAVRAEGYAAFIKYEDGKFYVAIGAYETENEAKAAAEKSGAKTYAPHDKCVLVYIEDRIWLAAQDEALHLTVTPLGGIIAAEGKEYRGELQFMRRDTGDMTVVNLVGFDDYLCGVVPREVSASWHEEAVKAQAVVSRTFAMMNLDKFKKYGFNLDSTTNSQAYAGVSIEHPASNKAIEDTHGEVVLYNGEPADVYFFATSGGKTGTANDAWGGEDKPYLVSLDDPYENSDEASYSKWEMKFTAAELKEKLASRDVHIGNITDVKLEYSDSGSGRVIKTVFCGTEGEKEYSRENIRWVLGIYSTAFEVLRGGAEAGGSVCALDKFNTFTQITIDNNTQLLSADGTANANGAVSLLSADGTHQLESVKTASGDFIFSGRGWGHGVGMSQWGAKGMAENGYSYKEIIEYYFKGTQVG